MTQSIQDTEDRVTRILQHRRQDNPHRPAENLLFSTPIGLNDLGALFRIEAPFIACRLCGALYQSDLDRLCRDYLESGRISEHFNPLSRETFFTSDIHAIRVLDEATERRDRWHRLHERRNHTEAEIKALDKTGFALTPEAAHKLAPFGITPLGNLHSEIADALFTAPRVPDSDAEY